MKSFKMFTKWNINSVQEANGAGTHPLHQGDLSLTDERPGLKAIRIRFCEYCSYAAVARQPQQYPERVVNIGLVERCLHGFLPYVHRLQV